MVIYVETRGMQGKTRPGPNRVAADMGGNRGFDFLEMLIYQDFWRIFEVSLAFLGPS